MWPTGSPITPNNPTTNSISFCVKSKERPLYEVADCARSLILEQVTNGLAVRMAVMFLINGGKGPQEIAPS